MAWPACLGMAAGIRRTDGGVAPWPGTTAAFSATALGSAGLAAACVGACGATMRAAAGALARAFTIGGLAGFFGMLAGLALIGLTTSADANIALRYTLLSIAGVILGGGEFTGGRVSPAGAVIGAMTLTLAGSFLSFLRIPPDWQIGAQGAILILVLALRVLIDRQGRRA